MQLKKVLINFLAICGVVFLALALFKQLQNYIGLGFHKPIAMSNDISNHDENERVPAEIPLHSPAPKTTPPKIKEVSKENYAEDYGSFKQIGQSFYIYPENEYLLKKWGFQSSMFSLKTFLPVPDRTACKDDYCKRKHIHHKDTFTIEAIVEPIGGDSIKENKNDEQYTCKKQIYNCYYKAKFDDGEIGFMLVADFDSASDPSLVLPSYTPSRLQINPVTPDKKWIKSKKYFDNYFKKLSVKEGFTRDEVLRSGWGKPHSRTKSNIGSIAVEIWTYQNGMITFENGYISQITEVSY